MLLNCQSAHVYSSVKNGILLADLRLYYIQVSTREEIPVDTLARSELAGLFDSPREEVRAVQVNESDFVTGLLINI